MFQFVTLPFKFNGLQTYLNLDKIKANLKPKFNTSITQKQLTFYRPLDLK
jgi:hypothetical protein